MRFRTEYTLSFLSSPPRDLQFPIRIDFEGKVFEIPEIGEDGKSAKAFVEGPVDRDTFTIDVGPERLNGSEPSRGISFPEKADFVYFLSKMVHLLSFLIDTPVRYSRTLGGDLLIPEGPEDERCFNELGTKQVSSRFSTTLSARSFQFSTITDQTLQALATKEVGMALYSQALMDQDSVAKYQDLWKVLESAFCARDDKLVQLLAQYDPAKELGFTLDELSGLLTLRGRASHAESRSGIEELRYVISETEKRLTRLKCLVEQVLVTKKSWGIRSLGTERLTPVSANIKSDGTLVIIKSTREN
jgi:hypothetical protein